MLIGGEKQFFLLFSYQKTAIFELFFKVLSVFDAKWIQKYTLSAPLKLFSSRSFTKVQLAPYEAFPDTVKKVIKSLF